MDIPMYVDPDPAVVRDIKDGLAYFSNRSLIPWEVFHEDFLIRVAHTREEAEKCWEDANKPFIPHHL